MEDDFPQNEMTRGSRDSGESNHKKIRFTPLYGLIIGLTVLHLIPIWACKYFPTQDGPCHLENSYILLHYFDPDRVYKHYYDLNLDIFPNWFSHAFFVMLMRFVSPLIAEKVLLTIYMVAFVLTILYFLKSFGEERVFYSLLVFPFGYDYFMHMGFYNFSFSLSLMLLILAYWWRRRNRSGDGSFLWKLNFLLIGLYFCNILSHLLTLLSLLILTFFHQRSNVVKTINFFMALIPSWLLLLYYFSTRSIKTLGNWARGDWNYFSTIGSLVAFDTRDIYVGMILGILFAILIIYTFLVKKRRLSQNLLPSESLEDVFLLLAIIFSSFYFLLPNYISKGDLVTPRLSRYPFLMILPWLTPHLTKSAKYILGTTLTVLISIHFWFSISEYKNFNYGLEEYTAGIPWVEKNKTILPINFSYGGGDANKIGVYLHAASYYALATGAIELLNYEGIKGYFPLKYKPYLDPYEKIGALEDGMGNVHPWEYPQPIDYVLLWNSPEQFPALTWIQRNYQLIYSKGRLKLYKKV